MPLKCQSSCLLRLAARLDIWSSRFHHKISNISRNDIAGKHQEFILQISLLCYVSILHCCYSLVARRYRFLLVIVVFMLAYLHTYVHTSLHTFSQFPSGLSQSAFTGLLQLWGLEGLDAHARQVR